MILSPLSLAWTPQSPPPRTQVSILSPTVSSLPWHPVGACELLHQSTSLPCAQHCRAPCSLRVKARILPAVMRTICYRLPVLASSHLRLTHSIPGCKPPPHCFSENTRHRGFPGVIVVQSLSRVQLFVTPRTAARQASLSFAISQSLLKPMSIESEVGDVI